MSLQTGAQVVAAWDHLAASGPAVLGRVRTVPTGLRHGGDDVLLGVESDGARMLLVPVGKNARLRRIDLPHLQLRKTPLEDEDSYVVYAELRCPERPLWELFADLVAQIVQSLEQSDTSSVRPMYVVIDRWRTLFAGARVPLGAEAACGLFGELLVLERLLGIEASAHRIWCGPDRAPRDFESSLGAIEVKSSTTAEGRRVRIHGLDQLEAPQGGALALAWFRLRPVEAPLGRGLLELGQSVLDLCDDPAEVRRKLAAAGADVTDKAAERYRFEPAESLWFVVDDSFPKLTADLATASGTPLAVLDVEYTVDLSSHTDSWEDADVDAHIGLVLEGAGL